VSAATMPPPSPDQPSHPPASGPARRPGPERHKSGELTGRKWPQGDRRWVWAYAAGPVVLPLAAIVIFAVVTQGLRLDGTLMDQLATSKPIILASTDVAVATTNWLCAFFLAWVLMALLIARTVVMLWDADSAEAAPHRSLTEATRFPTDAVRPRLAAAAKHCQLAEEAVRARLSGAVVRSRFGEAAAQCRLADSAVRSMFSEAATAEVLSQRWLLMAIPVVAASIYGLTELGWPRFVGHLVVLWSHTLLDKGVVLRIHFAFMGVTCVLVGIALARIAFRAMSNNPNIERITRLQWASRDLLVLTSAALIVGVTGDSLFNRVVVAVLHGNDALAAHALGGTSTTLFAVFYSTLIATSFGPAEFVLRKSAEARAPSLDRPLAVEWLAQRGFATSAWSLSVRVLAAAAPMLADLVPAWVARQT